MYLSTTQEKKLKKSVSERAAEIVEAAEGSGRGWNVVVGEKMRSEVRSGVYSAEEIGEMMFEIEKKITWLDAWYAEKNYRAVGD